MSKGVIAAIVIVAILALGGAGIYLMNKGSTPSETDTTTATDSEDQDGTSLRNLMNLGQNQECTFTDTETESQGTVYVAGDNMRGDFTSSTNGQTIASHMIVDGDDMYFWMDGETEGFRASISAIEEASEQAEQYTQETGAVDLDQQVDYDCSPWSVDNSVFNPPSDVDFVDFGSMMQEATENLQQETGVSCESCEQLPEGESRTQCLQALAC